MSQSAPLPPLPPLPPSRAKAPAPPKRADSPSPERAARSRVALGRINAGSGHRIVIYGPGGVGKTTFAAVAPGPVAFFDLDDSLPRLRATFEDQKIDIRVVGGIATWQDIRDALHAPGWNDIRTIVIDSATRAEELAIAHTLDTVPHEKQGIVIRRIEDYGYGKGYQHVYDTFLSLLGDLDQHTRAGRHVVLICHDCTATVPNPHGDDWLRYEPRLQSLSSGKASTRLRVREWADHVLFLGYDVDVRDGKGVGTGTRTIYPCELPHCMAKSRTADTCMALVRFDQTPWARILM